MDDATLLRRARKGHEAAFCQLYEKYQRRIHAYAARLCGPERADDVVQETFLAVLNAKGFDSAKGTVGGYLFGVARHHVFRRLAERGERLVDVHDLEQSGAGWPVATPLDTLEWNEVVDALRNAIQTLPVLCREVVVLCDLQEMDYAMAADVIEVPIGTVRSRLHRARALLATALAQHRPDELRRKHG